MNRLKTALSAAFRSCIDSASSMDKLFLCVFIDQQCNPSYIHVLSCSLIKRIWNQLGPHESNGQKRMPTETPVKISSCYSSLTSRYQIQRYVFQYTISWSLKTIHFGWLGPAGHLFGIGANWIARDYYWLQRFVHASIEPVCSITRRWYEQTRPVIPSACTYSKSRVPGIALGKWNCGNTPRARCYVQSLLIL